MVKLHNTKKDICSTKIGSPLPPPLSSFFPTCMSPLLPIPLLSLSVLVYRVSGTFRYFTGSRVSKKVDKIPVFMILLVYWGNMIKNSGKILSDRWKFN